MPEFTSTENVGILGVGVVGGALRDYFAHRGVHPRLYDPGLEIGSFESVDTADLVFVCVPTPYVPGQGFNASLLEEAVARLSGSKTVVIKSTVLPGTTDRLQAQNPQHRFLFNPEFLRENSALQDFLQPARQIVGHAGRWDQSLAQEVLDALPRAPYEAVMPARAAELVKYASNAFLAVKVIFANELYDLCAAVSADFEDVRAGLAADARIGPSHLDVLDGGYRGYGGKCLPKDTMALLGFAADLGQPLRLLQAAHDVNLTLRGESISADLALGGTPLSEALAA